MLCGCHTSSSVPLKATIITDSPKATQCAHTAWQVSPVLRYFTCAEVRGVGTRSQTQAAPAGLLKSSVSCGKPAILCSYTIYAFTPLGDTAEPETVPCGTGLESANESRGPPGFCLQAVFLLGMCCTLTSLLLAICGWFPKDSCCRMTWAT